MLLAVLHLSDSHITGPNDELLARAPLIARAVISCLHEKTSLIIAFSGDVAYAGKHSQYEVAHRFLLELTEELQRSDLITLAGVSLVPGNHDCDFDVSGDARTDLMRSAVERPGTAKPDGDSIKMITKVQDSFFAFADSYSTDARRNRVAWRRSFDLGDVHVTFRCLNTAVFSVFQEQPGRLQFPISSFDQDIDESNLVVTMFHHPYGWLAPDNAKALRRLVEHCSDVVLTGHEHAPDSFTKVDPAGEQTSYVEGAALQAAGTTGFNLLTFNLVAKTYQIFPFFWQEDIYRPRQSTSKIFVRKQALMDAVFEMNPQFANELEEIGTGFSHAVKNLSLRDIFVFPDLQTASLISKNPGVVSGENVTAFVLERSFVHIAGPPLSGKTTLAKILTADLAGRKGLVPVLLNGADVRSGSGAEFRKTVEREFGRQYSPSAYEKYIQRKKDLNVLIIDDWNLVRLPTKIKQAVIEEARTIFGKVIILSDDASLFRQLTEGASFGVGEDVGFCEIKPFGYQLRTQLIKRWHSAGPYLEIDEMELTQKISNSERLIDSLISKGLVPSFPLFIFSVLQFSADPVQDNLAYGSYGHIYESLLAKSLSQASQLKSSLGQKYTYLSLVAYEMFRSERSSLSEDQLRLIHRRYETEYHVPADESQLWSEFERARVLVRSGGEFRFQYKYAFYFFVAKYFQEEIGNFKDALKLRSDLCEMANCVHNEDCANILIFYVYLTKDRILIEQIVSVASQIFDEKESANLTSDIDFVNKLATATPEVVVNTTDIEGNREKYRARLDSAEPSNALDVPTARSAYQKGLDTGLKVQFGTKSLEVMGQVVRNFPLDLKGDLKLALTKCSYVLTFRMLRAFLDFMNDNAVSITEAFSRLLRGHEAFAAKSTAYTMDKAKEAVITIIEAGIFSMIKRVSFAVGTRELTETYARVRDELGDQNLPARLADLCIKLEHTGTIPTDDIRTLERELRANWVVYTVLKLLVAEHLQLFPCPYHLQQQLIDLFKFKREVIQLGKRKLRQLKAE